MSWGSILKWILQLLKQGNVGLWSSLRFLEHELSTRPEPLRVMEGHLSGGDFTGRRG